MSAPVRHPVFARLYERGCASADARGAREHRRRLLAGVRGRVIEVGAGNGANLEHYPAEVSEVLAVEPEPHLREAAGRAARDAAVKVTVLDGVADALPAPDGAFDAAVASLVLCSVPDQASALAEVRRVLRPGGELRFYEHVQSDRTLPARVHRLLDATIWPRVAGGCHLSRDTARAIEDAGFEMASIERFAFSPGPLSPAYPHILGLARKPP
jgi:ubiquinone/menaquinone biosynthesis C-methylase UbiE